MLAKVFFRSVIVAMTISCCASQNFFTNFFKELFLINDQINVTPECVYPYWNEVFPRFDKTCRYYSFEKEEDFDITAWYYEPEVKTCRPLYSLHGHNTCPRNFGLAKTKNVCEEKCGVKCLVRDDNANFTVYAYCMDQGYCTIPDSEIVNPEACQKGTRCCPQDTEDED